MSKPRDLVKQVRGSIKDSGVKTYAWILAEINNDPRMSEVLTDTDRKGILRIMKKIERSQY